MIRRFVILATLLLLSALFVACATDDTPDPEPMPQYANPYMFIRPNATAPARLHASTVGVIPSLWTAARGD
jgi:hypothetical protein